MGKENGLLKVIAFGESPINFFLMKEALAYHTHNSRYHLAQASVSETNEFVL